MNQVDEWRRSILVEREWAGADLPGLTNEELDVLFKESAADRMASALTDAENEVQRELISEQVEDLLAEALKRMQEKWPTAADWNVVDDDFVEILDKDDELVTVITGKELDAFL